MSTLEGVDGVLKYLIKPRLIYTIISGGRHILPTLTNQQFHLQDMLFYVSQTCLLHIPFQEQPSRESKKCFYKYIALKVNFRWII